VRTDENRIVDNVNYASFYPSKTRNIFLLVISIEILLSAAMIIEVAKKIKHTIILTVGKTFTVASSFLQF
jgi:hypothetical protein